MLSQMHNGMLKPVAFFLKKILPAECNYIIYDKELLVIVKSFKTWKPELASVDQPMKVYTNHKNINCFIMTKHLNWQQACWAKFLSEFNFKISYRPGKQGEKPDILTFCSQDLLKDIKDLQQRYQFQILLQDHQLDKNVKKVLVVMFCINTAIDKAIDKGINETVDANKENKENKEITNVKEFSEESSNNSFSTHLQQIILKSSRDEEDEIDKTRKLLKKLFEKAYKDNEIVKEIIDAKAHDLWKLPMTN